MGIARTFQNIRLYNDMSVIDNVKVGMHNSVRENLLAAVTHGFGYRKAERQAEATALEMLDFFGMADLAHAQAGSLPYGAQRRLEIVRALASGPLLPHFADMLQCLGFWHIVNDNLKHSRIESTGKKMI